MIRDLVTIVLVGFLLMILLPPSWKGPLTTALFVVFAIVFLWARPALSQEPLQGYHSNPGLLNWIPSTCCVTNDCCWEIAPEEVVLVGDNIYRIKSTGQEVKAQWSKDGRYYRCACDYDATEQRWNRHQGANTRCLFVPIPST